MQIDFGTISVGAAVGVPLIIGGLQIAGWRHRAIIIGLIGVGGACILAGIAAPLLASSWPQLYSFMSGAAAAPSSWVTILLFVAALFIFSRGREPSDQTAWEDNDDEQGQMIEFFRTRFEQLDKIVFPSLWDKLREIDTRTAIPPNLGSGLTEAIRSVEGALQSQLVRGLADISGTKSAFDRDIQQVRGQMARQDEELLRVLDFATTHTTFVLFGNIIRFAPNIGPSSEVISEECEGRIKEYLDAIQTTLAGSDYAERMENTLKHAQAHIDHKFEKMTADDYPEGVAPAIVRRRAIARCQLEFLLQWMKEQRVALQGQIAAKRATLATLLKLRSRY